MYNFSTGDQIATFAFDCFDGDLSTAYAPALPFYSDRPQAMEQEIAAWVRKCPEFEATPTARAEFADWIETSVQDAGLRAMYRGFLTA